MKDAAAVLGLVMVGVGLWWRAPWVSLVVVGGLLMAVALIGVFRDDPRPPDGP